MDVLSAWKLIKIIMGFGSICIAAISVVAVWRLRGILHWQRSLRDEVENLIKEAQTASGQRKQALERVFLACQQIKESTSIELKELMDLMAYIRSIAACYHPDSQRPELQIRIGRVLYSVRRSVDRLNQILCRPGFKKLQRVKIRHLRQALEWYEDLRRSRVAKLILSFGDTIRRIYWLRLLIFPDIFTLLAYFSNRLTVLVLAKNLMIDIYLFVGRMSIVAYEETGESHRLVDDIETIENTLEEIHLFKFSELKIDDPQILKIREQLVGIDRMLIRTPGFGDLKKAVEEAAGLIAKKYFPDVESPLEEAALGPLLIRFQSWLYSLCESENLPVIKRFHGIKLVSLYEVKSVSDMLLSRQLTTLAKRTRDMYRWMRWPLKIYRWIKKTSPLRVSLYLGWVIVKKSLINLICRHCFDTACQELENVYRQSI